MSNFLLIYTLVLFFLMNIIRPVINIALYDLLGRMLCKDPNYRITIPEIEEHSWVNVGGCLSINHTQLNDSRMELE
ncbi:hypothetical protein HZS_6090 [Henneguya salminicola]|nr:hypothetical protein HZS_6090 [Henneguya salminicola]